MNDLQIAKEELLKGHSLAIVKEGIVLARKNGNWVNPIVEAFDKLREKMHGSSVADRVIGKAAAVICIYAGAKEVYTPLISEPGKLALEKASIKAEYENIIPGILNPNKTGLCLAEEKLIDVDDPLAGMEILWDLLKKDRKNLRLNEGEG